MGAKTDRSYELCRDCGLCCDGSLFWAIPMDPDEDAPVDLDEHGRLCQPCARFQGTCTIYADRPRACRAFNCGVLQRHQAGQHDRPWALGQIAGMRRLVTALDGMLPGRGSVYRRAADFLTTHKLALPTPGFQRQNRALLQALAAYEQALKAFHVPEDA